MAILALGLLGIASACVTQGTHDGVVRERDGLRADRQRLETKVERLSASNESLGEERVALLDDMENLRENRETLARNVHRLERAKSELSESLRASEAAAASRSREISELQGTYEALVGDLESEVASGRIEIEQLRNGLRLNLSQGILFATGASRVRAEGRAVLVKVSARLRDLPHRIEVQGHTDDVPIRNPSKSRYPSNWELAAARASDVVRLLAESGVDPARMTAVSFGEYAPIASNETPEGRAQNRRIEIRLHEPVERVDATEPAAGAAAESATP